MRFLFTVFILAVLMPVYAQLNGPNDGFETWTGTTLNAPVNWGIGEYLFGGDHNRFLFKDSLPANVSSGNYSVKMVSDTTSVADLELVPGVLTLGNMLPTNSHPYSQGMPFTGRPSSIGFALKIDHPKSDTVYWDFTLTRWNNTTMQPDTLAVGQQFIPDAVAPQNQWFWIADSLHYLLPGEPDTLHLVLLGGQAHMPERKGNITWMDDVSFFYTGTGVVHLDADDAVRVFPNPASGMLKVKVDDYLAGTIFTIYNVKGEEVLKSKLTGAVTDVDISNLPSGQYLYRLSATGGSVIHSGKFSVAK